MSADEVWRKAVRAVRLKGHVQESRDQLTREVVHTAITVHDPRQRLVFARPLNPAFAIAEAIWILSGGNDVSFLSFWNHRMTRFADADRTTFHGAYGYRLGSRPRLSESAEKRLRRPSQVAQPKFDQLVCASEALRRTPHSRQVVLQIWDRECDMPDPAPRSRDVPCSIMSHLMVRAGRLDWLHVMRSNDLVWGTPYNIIQFTTIQEIVAGWIGVDVGGYHHVSDSLHVYERHWSILNQDWSTDADLIPTSNDRNLRLPYSEWSRVWVVVVDAALALTEADSVSTLKQVRERVRGEIPDAYYEWIALLTAEALRRRGYGYDALAEISEAGAYWAKSWRLWEAATRERRTTPREMTDVSQTELGGRGGRSDSAPVIGMDEEWLRAPHV